MSGDRDLGMDRAITRRDFLQGATSAALAGAALGCPAGRTGERQAPRPGAAPEGRSASSHPPARAGLRGSHAGSFETAHKVAWEGWRAWGPVRDTEEEYDLVVVGSGISGLSAAHFYREQHPDARILILENHDDFGGHARRNEFELGGRSLLGYGGSQTLEAPSDYSDVAKGLLRDLAVDVDRFETAYDRDFYRRHGLASAVFFDREHYGVDRLVRTDYIDQRFFVPLAPSGVSHEEAVAQMPLSEKARADLVRIRGRDRDRLPDVSIFAEPEYLAGISYRDFLVRHLEVDEEVLALLQDLPAFYFGVGIEGVSALEAMGSGLPGAGSTSLGHLEGLARRVLGWLVEPYIHHFPDGNASVTRLLVRRLIPGVASGSTMEDVVTASFDYGALDAPASPVRLRLSSTVVEVRHDGDPASAERVDVVYVQGGQAQGVRARNVVLACYNMMIPHLCPELPAPQAEALRELVKVPLVYTNVLLENWRAWQTAGVGLALAPGSWHRIAVLDFPVSLGEYGFARTPDDPIVVHMQRVPLQPGRPLKDQYRLGRAELLATPFEQIERDIRRQLAGMFAEEGFDPAREIAAITVNRWPHGYAYAYNRFYDPEYPEGEAPHEIGRRPWGRVAIANSDAGGRAYVDCAIDEAWRAVNELPGD
jgi:spermidine dehydrogenase